MNDILTKLAWAVGTIGIAVVVASHFLTNTVIEKTASFGTTGAGITNLTGLSITGTPGTLDASGGFTLNSVPLQGVKMTMNTATNTLCALQNPSTTATSSFTVNVNITTSTSSATNIVIATSSTAFATTSAIGNFYVAANANASFSGPGTTTSGSDGVVGPSQWVTVGTQNAAVTYGYTFGGTCDAVFQSN